MAEKQQNIVGSLSRGTNSGEREVFYFLFFFSFVCLFDFSFFSVGTANPVRESDFC